MWSVAHLNSPCYRVKVADNTSFRIKYKKAFQLNANHPLADIVNDFEHVLGRGCIEYGEVQVEQV